MQVTKEDGETFSHGIDEAYREDTYVNDLNTFHDCKRERQGRIYVYVLLVYTSTYMTQTFQPRVTASLQERS